MPAFSSQGYLVLHGNVNILILQDRAIGPIVTVIWPCLPRLIVLLYNFRFIKIVTRLTLILFLTLHICQNVKTIFGITDWETEFLNGVKLCEETHQTHLSRFFRISIEGLPAIVGRSKVLP